MFNNNKIVRKIYLGLEHNKNQNNMITAHNINNNQIVRKIFLGLEHNKNQNNIITVHNRILALLQWKSIVKTLVCKIIAE